MNRYKILPLLLVFVTAIVCNGQSFLSKYPELTKRNLNEFFLDWKAYSDSVAATNVIKDSVLADIIKKEYAVFEQKEYRNHRYVVCPQTIIVGRYYTDIDTTSLWAWWEWFAESLININDDKYAVDSITPYLPDRGLYLTQDIEKLLSVFSGGLKDGKKYTEFKKDNIKKLKKYIPVVYGHWGGYWWFTSLPLIESICYANNIIDLFRRKSWCTGDQIWYINENGKFVRCPDPKWGWIE